MQRAVMIPRRRICLFFFCVRNSYIALQAKDQKIKESCGDALGHFRYKRGDAQFAGRDEQSHVGKHFPYMQIIIARQEMQAAEAYADDGRDRGSQTCSSYAHPHGKYKYVIEKDVKKAAAHGGCHGKGGCSVIPHKGCKDLIGHEEGRKQDKYPKVGDPDPDDLRVSAHEMQDKIRP